MDRYIEINFDYKKKENSLCILKLHTDKSIALLDDASSQKHLLQLVVKIPEKKVVLVI